MPYKPWNQILKERGLARQARSLSRRNIFWVPNPHANVNSDYGRDWDYCKSTNCYHPVTRRPRSLHQEPRLVSRPTKAGICHHPATRRPESRPPPSSPKDSRLESRPPPLHSSRKRLESRPQPIPSSHQGSRLESRPQPLHMRRIAPELTPEPTPRMRAKRLRSELTSQPHPPRSNTGVQAYPGLPPLPSNATHVAKKDGTLKRRHASSMKKQLPAETPSRSSTNMSKQRLSKQSLQQHFNKRRQPGMLPQTPTQPWPLTEELHGTVRAQDMDYLSTKGSRRSSHGPERHMTGTEHWTQSACPPPPPPTPTETLGQLGCISMHPTKLAPTTGFSRLWDVQETHQSHPSTLKWFWTWLSSSPAWSALTLLASMVALLMIFSAWWGIPMAAATSVTRNSAIQSNTNTAFLEEIGQIYPTAAWVQIEFRLPIHQPLSHAMRIVAMARTKVNQLFTGRPQHLDHQRLMIIRAKADSVLRLIHDVSHEVGESLTSNIHVPPWINAPAHEPSIPDPKVALRSLDLSAFDPLEKKIKRRRTRRDVNGIKVNLNMGNPVAALFSGISNLVHGHTIGKLSHKVTILVSTVQAMAAQHSRLIDLMNEDMWEQASLQTLWWSLDEVETLLRLLIDAAAHLARGRISPSMMPPGKSSHLFSLVDLHASQEGYSVPFSSVFTLFSLPVTSARHSRGKARVWRSLLHIPLVDKKAPFRAYFFPNAPFAGPSGSPYHFSVGSGILGVSDGLPSEVQATFVSEGDILNKCLQFNSTWVCPEIPILKQASASCPACLLLGDPANCEVQPVLGPTIPILRRSRIYAFHKNTTTLAISCPGQQARLHPIRAQTVITLDPGCSASTKAWHYTSPVTSVKHAVTLVKLPPIANWTFFNQQGLPGKGLSRLQDNLTRIMDSLDQLEEPAQWTTPDVIIIIFCALVLAAIGPQVNYLACRLISANLPAVCCVNPSRSAETEHADPEPINVPDATPTVPDATSTADNQRLP